MFCSKCGKQLEDRAKFCPYCGAVTGSAASKPASNTRSQDPSPSKTSRHDLPKWAGIAGGIAVGAIVLVIAVALVAGMLGGDKGAVAKAAAKSIAAWSDAAESAGLPDLEGLYASEKYSQSGELSLVGIDMDSDGSSYDLSALEGLGIRWNADVDLPRQKLSLSATPFYGAADLVSVQMVMDGSKIYAASPELTNGTFYGLDTETLGQDLTALGAGDEAGGLSFNIFDIVEQYRSVSQLSEDAQKALEAADEALYDAIVVEKAGSKEMDINGHNVNCTVYSVTVPKDALADCLHAVEDALEDLDYTGALLQAMSSLGLPDEAIDGLAGELAGYDSGDHVAAIYDSMEDILDQLGDIELTAYTSGGYLMAVTYTKDIDGSLLEIGAYLGGGQEYVDDFRFVFRVDGGETAGLALISNGDHSAKSGIFTDETRLELSEGSYTALEIGSQIRYSTKEDQDNFSWTIDAGAFALDMRGQLATGKDSMDLALDQLTLRSSDGVSVTLGFNLAVDSYGDSISVRSPVMLSTLDQSGLLSVVSEIGGNAYSWAMGLSDTVSGLIDLF